MIAEKYIFTLINPARVSKRTNQTGNVNFFRWKLPSDTPADPHLRGDLAEPGKLPLGGWKIQIFSDGYLKEHI